MGLLMCRLLRGLIHAIETAVILAVLAIAAWGF